MTITPIRLLWLLPLLLVVVVVVTLARIRAQQPTAIKVNVTYGATVISTQTVPLR